MRVEVMIQLGAVDRAHHGATRTIVPPGTRGRAEPLYAEGRLLLFISDQGAKAVVPIEKLRVLEAEA